MFALEEDDEDDEDGWLPDLSALFESFLQEPPRRKPASQKKPIGKAASGRKSPAPDKTTPASTTPANKGRGKGKYPRIAKQEPAKRRSQYPDDDADA